jgi:RHS repeat-associated protein
MNAGAAGANVSKYDGLGNRVSRTTSGFTVNFLNDLQPPLAQTVAIGFPSLGTTSRQVQTPMGVLAQKDPSGAWEWMLQDGLGSVRSVVNNALTVLEHRHYEPYGSLFAGAMAETPFGFTGEWRDGGTGMVYLRARYYNPAMGAFVSRDPFEGTASRPMSLNLYAYVQGNPVNLIDPNGLNPCDCIEVQYYTGNATLEEVEACLASIPRPGESSCPRMPLTGKVYDWEKELLNLTAASEYRLSAAGIPESDVAKLGYALSWVVLNRITSPCWGGNFTRIHQAAFSGSAIRNRGVFGTAAFDETSISSLVVTLTNGQGQSVTFIDNENAVTGAQAREFTTHILQNFLANSPGDQRTVEAMRPATNRALDEWCSGMNGPGVAVNAVFYATLSNSQGLYDNAINEIYDQLGMLERLGDGASCGGNFGWVGTSTDHSVIVSCNNTLAVRVEPAEWGPTRQMIRTRGQLLAAERLIQYP